MHSTDLRSIVTGLLESHGYAVHCDETLEGRSGAVYDVPILAEGTTTLLIEFKDSPDPVEDADLEYLGRLVDDAGADHAVLVHQGPAPYGRPLPDGVTLWGPKTLRTMIGDHVLHQQTGAFLSPLVFGATEAPPLPPMPTSSSMAEVEHPTEIPDLFDNGFSDLLPSFGDDDGPAGGFDFDSLESLDAPVPKAAATTSSGGFGPSALRPKIPVHEARAMVKDRISNIDHETLMLWPVHIVDYECDLMVDGTLKQDTVHGRIMVRGDKQGTEEVDAELVDVAAIGTMDWDGATDDHSFRRDADVALADAKKLIMESHTKMVDMEVEDDASNFTMTERKKVAPDGDQIRLDHRAATYRPAWRFESANGHVIIDALTGETMDESLRTRSGDTIIVD